MEKSGGFEEVGKLKVEPGEFAWIPKPWEPGIYRNYNHAPSSGCIRVLRESANNFGITVWGLARLLGLPWLHQIYAWLKGTKRPCQMYMVRLVKLHQLQIAGLDLATIHYIAWDTGGAIHLKGPRRGKRRQPNLSPENQALMDKFMSYSPR